MTYIKVSRIDDYEENNERWIINDKGRAERWFVDSEGDVYVTLRKLREPRPNCSRIMTLKKYAYKTMKEAENAARTGETTPIRQFDM